MSTLKRIWRGLADVFGDRSHFDFIGRRNAFFALSAIALVIGFASLGFRGLNLGIDFEGGTSWQGTVTQGTAKVGDIRDALRPEGEADARVTILGADRKSFRVQAKIEGGSPQAQESKKHAVTNALADYSGQKISVSDVGPTFGAEITDKAIRALVVFLLAVVVYLAIRFEAKMAGAAIVALIHDIGITVGVYSLTGFEVTPATVIAILTILGYSLYDTVVVFDKVRENTSLLGRGEIRTYSDMVNRSLNQTLMRSLNTSFTTLIPVASLLVIGAYALGALTIRDFSLALFIGLLSGTYSSIFVASTALAAWKEREPRYRAMHERAERRLAAESGAGPVEQVEDEEAEAEEQPEAEATEASTSEEPSEPRVRVGAPDTLKPRPRRPRRRKRR